MKLGKKECKQCGNQFQKVQPLQFLCSYDCYNEYTKKKTWGERKEVLKDNTTTLSDLKKKLEKEINEIVRKIDYGCTCMMCDNPMERNYACHYHAVGSNDTLRFNLLNIWGGCYSCNGHKGGNIIGYDMQLIQKAGKHNWEYIKFELVKEYPLIKLSRDEIKDITLLCRNLKKDVKNERRSMIQRWQLRLKLNELIGIYKNSN